MNTFTKILVTLVAVGLFVIIFALIAASASNSGGHGAGIIGLVLFAALIGGLRAVWKKKNNDNKDDDDNSVLQK